MCSTAAWPVLADLLEQGDQHGGRAGDKRGAAVRNEATNGLHACRLLARVAESGLNGQILAHCDAPKVEAPVDFAHRFQHCGLLWRVHAQNAVFHAIEAHGEPLHAGCLEEAWHRNAAGGGHLLLRLGPPQAENALKRPWQVQGMVHQKEQAILHIAVRGAHADLIGGNLCSNLATAKGDDHGQGALLLLPREVGGAARIPVLVDGHVERRGTLGTCETGAPVSWAISAGAVHDDEVVATCVCHKVEGLWRCTDAHLHGGEGHVVLQGRAGLLWRIREQLPLLSLQEGALVQWDQKGDEEERALHGS
mmetsp:Transcript_50927/g.121826  ORF Transcript_50927/g.121826 Transcript_50927/m.121826 type:complete len:307 (+) Transcript_50927:807-1727(+)